MHKNNLAGAPDIDCDSSADKWKDRRSLLVVVGVTNAELPSNKLRSLIHEPKKSFFHSRHTKPLVACIWFDLGRIDCGHCGSDELRQQFWSWCTRFSSFFTFALVPLSIENRLIVTNLEIEFQMLLGGKLIHRLEGVRSIKLRYTSSGPYLELTRNLFSSFGIQNDWKEAYPTIIEATQALNPSVKMDEELLERYGQPPYGIFGL